MGRLDDQLGEPVKVMGSSIPINDPATSREIGRKLTFTPYKNGWAYIYRGHNDSMLGINVQKRMTDAFLKHIAVCNLPKEERGRG